MRDIYNIYNGILSGMDSTLSKGDKISRDLLNTLGERMIRIVSASAHMDDKEVLAFREILNKSIANGGKNITCFMPIALRDQLIVASDRKLKLKDFKGISVNSKEYEYRCSMDYLTIESYDNYAFDKETIAKAKSSKGQSLRLRNTMTVTALGDAIVYQVRDMLYIVIDGIMRIPIRTLARPSGTSLPIDTVL